MPHGDFETDLFLGRGTFGEVYRAVNKKTGNYYAVKIVDFEETDDIRKLFNEILTLTKLKSDYLNKYHESFVVGSTMWIVLEYCGGGLCLDLIKAVGRLPDEIASYIIKSVLLGVVYLHKQRLIHRDIKLANIFITDRGLVKLGDFGVSSEIVHTMHLRRTMVGTGHWMAPEVITNSGYDHKADIWSIGITAYELLTGRSPTAKLPTGEALRKIPFSSPPRLPSNYSEKAQSFVERALVKNPRYRPDAIHLLDHHFISSCMADHSNMEMMLLKKEQQGVKPKIPLNKSRHVSDLSPREPILWDFLEDTGKENLENHKNNRTEAHVKENKHLEILLETCSRVSKRARCDRTRQFIKELSQMINDGEENNNGLCQALIEDLGAVYREKIREY